MKTYSEVLELLERSESQLKNLSRIAKDEEKEYGCIKENTIMYFNAIMYAISNAGDLLENGLKGEF